MLAVTAVTGQLGRKVLEELKAYVDPDNVAALARNVDRAKELAEEGFEVRRADYRDPASLAGALRDVEAVLLISGTRLGERVAQHQNVIDAARKARVKHVVYTSVIVAEQRPEPIFADHGRTEAALAESGLHRTILRNNFYFEPYRSELDRAAKRGAYRSPIGEPGGAFTNRDDIAAVAAAILADADDHRGAVYEVTGPAAIGGEALAALAAERAGVPVVYEPITAEELADDYRSRGYPEEALPMLLALEDALAQGQMAGVSDVVATIAGRPAKTARELALANVAA